MALVRVVLPSESNVPELRIVQFVSGMVMLVALNTSYAPPGRPSVTLKIRLVPTMARLPILGPLEVATSMEPSNSSLLVQTNPGASGGNVMLENDPAFDTDWKSWKLSPAASAVGPSLVTVSAPP